MKELKLRKDYPKWNWTETTKRQKAYAAMINKTNTSNFAKSVWNDMVDCLYNAMQEMGLEWNDYEASYSATKFLTWSLFDLIPQAFTARMFNSVKYNIQKLINSTFIWEYDTEYEGYVGRSTYRGNSTSSSPDTLYGSAIIELARKINLVIDVFKDEALLMDETSTVSSASTIAADLGLPELQEASSSIESRFSESGTMSKADTTDFSAVGSVNSSGKGKITLKRASSTFETQIHSFSFAEAALTLEELYKNLYSTIFHYAMTSAKLIIDYHSVKITAQITNLMLNESRLSYADVLEMITHAIASTSNNADLNMLEPLDVRVDTVARTLADVLLTNAPEKKFTVSLDANTELTCHLENFKGSTFISIITSKERDTSRLVQGVARRITSQIVSRATLSIPQLVRAVVNPMTMELIECAASIEGTITEPQASYIFSNSLSEQEQDALLALDGVSRLNVNAEFDSSSNVELEALLIRALSVAKTYRAQFNTQLISANRVIAASSLTSAFSNNIRLELFSTGDSMIVREIFGPEFDIRLEALNYGDNYPVVDSLYHGLFDAELENIEPFPVRIDEEFHADSDSEMRVLDASKTALIDSTAFEEIIETRMSIVNLGYLELDVSHDAFLFADMSFDPASWLNPVQIEKDLEIYQVYESELVNKNLNLE